MIVHLVKSDKQHASKPTSFEALQWWKIWFFKSGSTVCQPPPPYLISPTRFYVLWRTCIWRGAWLGWTAHYYGWSQGCNNQAVHQNLSCIHPHPVRSWAFHGGVLCPEQGVWLVASVVADACHICDGAWWSCSINSRASARQSACPQRSRSEYTLPYIAISSHSTVQLFRGQTDWGRFRTARAQCTHSANYYGDYPGNSPENHPPAESCTTNSNLENSNI